MTEQPLSGIRVIEVGGTVESASATKTFSDYGAMVITVEPLHGGPVRRIAPFAGDCAHLDRGAFHLALNTGKQSIVLDTSSPSGSEVLSRLVEDADLLVVDAPPEEAKSLLAVAAAVDTSAIAITPHGLEGPYAERTENETSVFAWSTRMRHHAHPGRPPLRYAPQLIAIQVGATATAVGMAAIWARQHGAPRQEIDVAAVEALAGNVDSYFLTWSFTGVESQRAAGRSKAAYPAGNYRCKDGWVMFAASGERFFARLCEALGHPELFTDPRFSTPAAKAEHWDDFMEHLEPWLQSRTRHEVVSELQGFGVMVAPTLRVSDVLEDPQAVARGSFVDVEQPGVGTVRMPGAPFRLEDAWAARPAPRLGEHTTQLLDAAGYTRDEQMALFRACVTG